MSLKHILISRALIAALSTAFVFAAFTPNVFACAQNEVDCEGTCYPEGTVCLLEPPPGAPKAIEPGEYAWQLYVNDGLWQWAIMIGVGLAVLNGTIAGFQIMMGQRDLGKERFVWSVVGLILLLFAGVILNFINPNAFTTVAP